jgi:phage/plasmid primase-like uncharacterized protein
VSESDALSLHELEAYGRLWGSGRERRALCPFCGDEHKRDREHACLVVNADTGAWTCHRCNRAGLLTEHKTPRKDDKSERSRLTRPRRKPRPLPTPPAPSPEELAEQAAKRETLRRLWAPAVPLDVAAKGVAAGAAYLEGRGVSLQVAAAARVRFAADWYGRPAVVFPVQDEAGRLVAAEGRYIDAGTPKSRSAGPKGRGVFVATPGALEAEGVTLCEGPITALSVAACGFAAVALCGHASAPAWLVRRLALRPVFLAFDYGEQGADTLARKLARELAALGATPYRLTPPAGAGDWNDYLQAVGLEAVRAELGAAIVGALACEQQGCHK